MAKLYCLTFKILSWIKRRKSLDDLSAQRWRLAQTNISDARMKRVNAAYRKYAGNIHSRVGNFGELTDRQYARKFSRRSYVGLNGE